MLTISPSKMHFSSYLAPLIDIMPEIKLIPVRKLTNSFASVGFRFRFHFEHDAFSSVREKNVSRGNWIAKWWNIGYLNDVFWLDVNPPSKWNILSYTSDLAYDCFNARRILLLSPLACLLSFKSTEFLRRKVIFIYKALLNILKGALPRIFEEWTERCLC